MRAQYQDQLAKKRYEEQLVQQQKSQDEILRKYVPVLYFALSVLFY